MELVVSPFREKEYRRRGIFAGSFYSWTESWKICGKIYTLLITTFKNIS